MGGMRHVSEATIELAGYRAIERVGSGGLGDVYKALRVTTGGPVAIKVVREPTDRGATDRRVRRELDALLKLKGHANVVQVEELVEFAGGLALVMEYVSGGSLMDLLDSRGPLPTPNTVAAAVDVARALTDAHSLGIIHRDVKPHNVMVASFGQCKVCDFGIAAMLKDSASTGRTSALSYRYASPEEINDSPDVGPATDVYSFGVTIRQLLSGETNAQRAAGVRDASGGGVPSLRGVTDELLALVELMTAGSPGERPTAGEVLAALRRIDVQMGPHRVDSVMGARMLEDSSDVTLLRRPSDARDDPDSTVIRPQRVLRPSDDTTGGTSMPHALPNPDLSPAQWWETS